MPATYIDPAHANDSFPTLAARLLAEVTSAEPRLRQLDDAAAVRQPAPGKWSPKQVLGHLLDSACNNHQRFVRMQEASELALPGYSQDHWVQAQGYDDRPWEEIVAFWAAYNRHLAHVIERIPAEKDGVAGTVGGQPATLGYVARDYVGHVRHHLRQIFPDY